MINQALQQLNSSEAETYLIGTCLNGKEYFNQVSDLIEAGDFYHELYGRIWQTLEAFSLEGKTINPITVSEEMDNALKDQIFELAEDCFDELVFKDYAKYVVDYAHSRRMAFSISEAYQLLSDGEISSETLTDACAAISESLQDRPTQKNTFFSLENAAKDFVRKINKLIESDEELTGVSTGIAELDGLLSGFQPQDLIIIGARPAMGKTSLALQLSYSTAINCPDGQTLFFSLEMGKVSLIERVTARIANIPMSKIKRPKTMNQQELDRLLIAGHKYKQAKNWKGYEGDQPNIKQLISMIRKEHAVSPVKFVFLDYIQIMDYDKSNAVSEIATITTSLKSLARELDLTVIALSQLNREVEKNKPDQRRPNKSHLKDSGAIEQDADIIILPYRPEVDMPDDVRWKGKAELIIDKHRQGEIATLDIGCDLLYQKFYDLEY